MDVVGKATKGIKDMQSSFRGSKNSSLFKSGFGVGVQSVDDVPKFAGARMSLMTFGVNL